MAKPSTREELKQYCLRTLGKPVIEINVEDARNYNAMSKIISQFEPDVIIQLAAVSHANKSNKDPHTTFDHNLRTLENTLDYSKSPQSVVQQFIYFSSSMVYGHFESKQVSEETPGLKYISHSSLGPSST